MTKIQSYHMVEGGFITIRYTKRPPADIYDPSTHGRYQVTSIEFIPNGSLIGLHAIHTTDHKPYLYLEQDYAYMKQDELPAPLALLLPLTLLPLILFLRYRRNTE